jgi:5-hydroxyisourate hydrolase-like protein (transthyretin family)
MRSVPRSAPVVILVALALEIAASVSAQGVHVEWRRADSGWQSRVWGRVTDETGEPVAGAVLALVRGADDPSEAVLTARTDEDGFFELRDAHRFLDDPREIETATLLAAEAGHTRERRLLWGRDAPPFRRVDFRLLPEESISGFALAFDLSPLSGALVRARPDNQAGVTVETRADDRGRFRLGGLSTIRSCAYDPDRDADRPVAARVEVAAPGEPYRTGRRALLGAQNLLVRDYPQSAVPPTRRRGGPPTPVVPRVVKVRGVAVDAATGEPAAGVGFRLFESTRAAGVEVCTDAEGGFSIECLVAGSELNMEPVGVDWALNPKPGRPPENTLVLNAEDGNTLADLRIELARRDTLADPPLVIRAVDPAGKPLPGASLRLRSADGETDFEFGLTDATGRCAAWVPRGFRSFQVLGAHADWPWLRSPMTSGETDLLVARAEPLTEVEAVVLDADGHSAPEARLWQALRSGDRRNPPPDFDPLWPDSKGRVPLGPLPQGRHQVWATTREGALAVAMLDLGPGQSSCGVTLRLDPRPLAGRVVEHRGWPVEGARIGLGRGYRGRITAELGSTDADGRFALPWREARLYIKAENYPLQFVDPTRGEQMSIVLQPAIRFRGRVVDGEGQPVAQAWLRLEEDESSGNFVYHVWRGLTDEEGRINARGLHEGRWEVEIGSVFGTRRFRIDLPQDNPHLFTLDPRPSTP